MGKLYIVPTPIGNLEDITYRALRVLQDVNLVAAEDTRTTGRLLAHYGIKKPLTSYHEYNELAKLDTILTALDAGDVALVSDSGTPVLSDPGYKLVQAAIERGITIIALPGPSAMLPALAVSGLHAESFMYLGFLPRKAGARRAALEEVRGSPFTLVFYEAPHRLLKSLVDMRNVFGSRQITVACELTKLYEEIWRGDLGEAITHYQKRPPRGEITLVVEGAAEYSVPRVERG